MHNIKANPTTTHALERFLAVLGVAVCLILSGRIWQIVSDSQPIWPLPGLYLVEMVVLSLIALVGSVRNGFLGRAATWAAAGIFTAFSLMGAWTVGLAFLPAALIFAITGILLNRGQGQLLLVQVGIGSVAGITQIALMLTILLWL